ncbi:RibD family protein [Leuconostoc mesenteroides]|uniref:RibD family protein n=1 Tax=Leuconostoc mesenteroides TaxID=1245 RepID=UPI001EE3BD1A|nr:RibD family protein [Leuconostoc mesenteroides]MDV8926851.1 RibD family protein [Leuconostoc mesenteroides]
MSQNGFVAEKFGKRKKLTDELADTDVHRERATRSAIMIGSETMITDQPMLTVRHIHISHKQPLRVVIDRRGRLQNTNFDFSNNWLIYTENVLFSKQHSYVKLMSGALKDILIDLAKQNIQSVMVEGGPSLIHSFLKENLWQEMLIYTTDKVLSKDSLKGISVSQKPKNEVQVGNAVKKVYINHQGGTQ